MKEKRKELRIICKVCHKDLTKAYKLLVKDELTRGAFCAVHIMSHLGQTYDDYFEVKEVEIK